MAFRDLFQGGTCNADGQQNQSRQTNQFTQFMDQAMMGRHENQQIVQGQHYQNNNVGLNDQQIQNRQINFQKMDDVFRDQQQVYQQQQMLIQQQMQNQWQHEQMVHQQMLNNQNQQMDQLYQEQQKEYELDKMTEQFQNQMKMEDVYEQEESKELQKEVEQEIIKDSATSIIELMQNDQDPKFKQSKFLAFLRNIQDGKIVIEGDQIRETAELKMDNVFDQSQQQIQQNIQQMDNVYQQSEQQYQQNEKIMDQEYQKEQEKFQIDQNEMLQQWEEAIKDDQKFEQFLESQYKDMLSQLEKDAENGDILSDAWQKASDYEDQMLHKQVNNHYEFKQNNIYKDDPQAKQKAIQFYNQGQIMESVLAFEGQLQQDGKDYQSWRILGRIHQENDQDQPAVSCFLNAHQNCQNNEQLKDILFNLGVSCTNILDEVKAMQYLGQWLKIAYPQNNIELERLNQNNIKDFSMDQVSQMNDYMINQFQQQLQANPDGQLFQSLAVLYFIKRDYPQSLEFFKEALKHEPHNYGVMNKIGATLAHIGQSQEAISYYEKALDLKPNFVRVWVNLGIAYGYEGNYEESARFYLNALNLNPEAKHLWSYLHSCFVKRFDLVPKLAHKDIQLFKDDFEMIDMKDLPQPDLEYRVGNEQFVIKEWVEQILNNQ